LKSQSQFWPFFSHRNRRAAVSPIELVIRPDFRNALQ
jgi:hypothetical protein